MPTETGALAAVAAAVVPAPAAEAAVLGTGRPRGVTKAWPLGAKGGANGGEAAAEEETGGCTTMKHVRDWKVERRCARPPG